MAAADVTGRRLVIFDFDGTLANTVPSIVSTARTVLAQHGLTDEEMGDLTRLVGPPFPQAYSLVYGFSEEEAAQITAEYRTIYRSIGPSAWPLFDGVADLLARLRAAGRLTAVASSKQMRLVERALADNAVADLFDRALGKTSDAEGDKVAVIRRVVRELGLTEGDAVMVGDRHHDVEAAAACGIPCVGVTYGGTGTVEELMGAGACACAGTVEELGRVLLG
ncbi:HAD family hydrolase [Thermophilibacter sp.]|uniref:HAD family hydrolase n=1 Tax=Thermophilibacter sp. TaxID=2847309 RepID=UPI003A9423DE